MKGLNRVTGQPLVNLAHVRQSILDILTTPIGSRLLRRLYGSRVPDLLDQPRTPATRLQLIAATASAIIRYEPRVKLSRVDCQALPTGWRVTLSGHVDGRVFTQLLEV